MDRPCIRRPPLRRDARRAPGAIAQAITILATPASLPAMFHCSAGKDRTGVLAALLLGALGVPDETIVADYSLSRDAMERMLVWLQERAPDPETLARFAPTIRAAEPVTMEVFLAGFREQYGTFDDYFASLGLADAVATFRRDLAVESRRGTGRSAVEHGRGDRALRGSGRPTIEICSCLARRKYSWMSYSTREADAAEHLLRHRGDVAERLAREQLRHRREPVDRAAVGARPRRLVHERLGAVDGRRPRRRGSARSPGTRRAACRTARGPWRTAP